MKDVDQYRSLAGFANVFVEPWWLDLVAGEKNWDVLRAETATGPVYLPAITRSFPGGQQLLTPPFCGHLRFTNHEGVESSLVGNLGEILSRSAAWHLKVWDEKLESNPDFGDLKPRTTFVVTTTEDPTLNYDKNTKYEIRKAAKTLQISIAADFDLAIALIQSTFERQGLSLPVSAAKIKVMMETVTRLKRGQVWLASDSTGPHGVVFTVHDETTCYYLMGGTDAEGRKSGANTLLLDHVIRLAHADKKKFDFEGSDLPSIAKYFRGFGATPFTYHVWTKQLSAPLRLWSALWRRIS